MNWTTSWLMTLGLIALATGGCSSAASRVSIEASPPRPDV
jgi:hypothetical protein